MRQLLLLLVVAAAMGTLVSDAALAQADDGPAAASEAPAPQPNVKPATGTFARGPGHYLNWGKMLASWLLFACWVTTTGWVSTDCRELRLQYVRWNPIVFGTFIGFYVLLWLLPWFWLGFPLLVIAYVTPLATYIIYRNQQVNPAQRVLTPGHIRFFLSHHLAKVGIKIEAEKRASWELGPPIRLEGAGGDERHNRANMLAARQTPAFNEVRGMMAEMLQRRASALMLEFAQEQVAVRYMIDGVWHNDEPRSREAADPVLECFKILCGLKPQERRSRQKGAFAVHYGPHDYNAVLAAQGTTKGERVMIQVESEKIQFASLDDLGMRSKMQGEILGFLAQKHGFVLLSAMPASGLRSTTGILLQKTDRFTREFMAIEDAARPYEPVENIPVTTYRVGENVPEEEQLMHVMVKLFRMEPDVVVMRDLVDGESVDFLCNKANESCLAVGTVRAKDCAEAMLRVLALKVPPKSFARCVTAVLNQRLIRRLCDTCKEAYTPPPQVLQQLGIPEGRVESFYRPPQNPEEVCPDCNGIGYRGRTAIFELLVVDDSVRKILATGGKMDDVRRTARKSGMQNLQDEGIVLVAKGITSLPELMRVMKQ